MTQKSEWVQKTVSIINRSSYDDIMFRWNPHAPNGGIKKSKHTGETELSVHTLNDLLHMEFPENRWLVEGLVPLEGLTAVTGLPSSCKSTFTQTLAVCVASGQKFLNKFNTQKGGVLIIDKEDTPIHLKPRFRHFNVETDDVVFLDNDYYVEDTSLHEKLIKFIKLAQIKLIIIDSLVNIYRNGDENKSSDMSRVIRVLKQFQKHGASVIFVHHNSKTFQRGRSAVGGEPRGSGDIIAKVDTHITIEDKGKGLLTFKIKKSRQTELDGCEYVLRKVSRDGGLSLELVGQNQERDDISELAHEIIEYLNQKGDYVSRSEIHERFKQHKLYSINTVDTILKSSGLSVKTGDNNAKSYRT